MSRGLSSGTPELGSAFTLPAALPVQKRRDVTEIRWMLIQEKIFKRYCGVVDCDASGFWGQPGRWLVHC